jgi:hypothetical protein
MDWYLFYSGTVPVFGVYEKLNVPSCDWYIIFRYTRIQLGTFKTRVGGMGDFLSVLPTHHF